MDIQSLYDQYVAEIHMLDMKISELRGKREAYSNLHLDLYALLQESKGLKKGDKENVDAADQEKVV
jgi:hypothetical protein